MNDLTKTIKIYDEVNHLSSTPLKYILYNLKKFESDKIIEGGIYDDKLELEIKKVMDDLNESLHRIELIEKLCLEIIDKYISN